MAYDDFRLMEHHRFVKQLADRKQKPKNYEPSDVTSILPCTWISNPTALVRTYFTPVAVAEALFEPLRFVITVDQYPDETLANRTLASASYMTGGDDGSTRKHFWQKGKPASGYSAVSNHDDNLSDPNNSDKVTVNVAFLAPENPKRQRNIGIIVVLSVCLFLVIAAGIAVGVVFSMKVKTAKRRRVKMEKRRRAKMEKRRRVKRKTVRRRRVRMVKRRRGKDGEEKEGKDGEEKEGKGEKGEDDEEKKGKGGKGGDDEEKEGKSGKGDDDEEKEGKAGKGWQGRG
ncbi:hypothetical protein BC829DRAFT_67062 [Chytridium lagenaria]|nr:hypothetical protein BC829DRAFT_67062 [Chytridium lagenaria]